MHTKSQLPSFIIPGNIYEDDLYFGFWKTTTRNVNTLFNLKTDCMPKISFLVPLLFLEIAMKKTFNFDYGRRSQEMLSFFCH